MEVTSRRGAQHTLLAVGIVGAVAVAAGRLTGMGPLVGFAVFLGLQPLAMAWARGAPMITRRTVVAAVVGAGVGAAIQWFVA